MDSVFKGFANCTLSLMKAIHLNLSLDLRTHYDYAALSKDRVCKATIMHPLRNILDEMLYLSKTVTRFIRPKMEYCQPYLDLFFPCSSRLSLVFKCHCAALWVINNFSPCNLLSTDRTLLVYRYCHVKCSSELHSLFVPVQTFTARTHQAMYTVINPS